MPRKNNRAAIVIEFKLTSEINAFFFESMSSIEPMELLNPKFMSVMTETKITIPITLDSFPK